MIPHTPGQGSIQWRFWQAFVLGQSALMVHSGLQATYGSPKYSGMHWQPAALARPEQIALSPQGDGLQGSTTSVGAGAKIDLD